MLGCEAETSNRMHWLIHDFSLTLECCTHVKKAPSPTALSFLNTNDTAIDSIHFVVTFTMMIMKPTEFLFAYKLPIFS